MDPNTQTPDLQAATGQQPPVSMTGPSMMAALSGMQGPAPGLAAGSGMLAALGGHPGTNPYLQQQQSAQGQMVNQVLAVQEMQRRQEALNFAATQARQRRVERQQQSLNTMLDSMIASDDPRAKAFGWTQKGELMKQQGVYMPPDVIQGLARGKMTKGDIESLVLDVHANVDPATLQQVYPWLTPSHLGLAKSLAGNPDYMRRLGIDPEALAMKREDHDLKRLQYDLAVIREGRAEREFDAKLKADQDKNADHTALERQKMAETARHNKAMEALTKDRNDNTVLNKDEKRRKSLDVMEQALDEIESTALRLKQKGYLHESKGGVVGGLLGGDTGPAKAQANWSLFPNDPDLKNWTGPLRSSVIGMDRQILDEIGARGAMVWKNQMSQFEHPSSYEAAVAPARMMRKFLETARSGKGIVTEHVIVQLPDGSQVQEKNFQRGVTPLPPGGVIIKVID